jgi:hypothetical protein
MQFNRLDFIKRILVVFIIIQSIVGNTSYAQSGACSGGSYIDNTTYVNYTGSSAGDMQINTAGQLRIGASGVYDIYGATNNAGNITIDNGGILNIYGDMTNSGTITIVSGGTINFYGQAWSNTNVATVNGTGDIYFTSVRPTIPAAWTTAVPCITSYSGGTFSQNLNGGGNSVDMNVRLFVNNANNVVLTGTTSIAGSVNFAVNNGDILLGNFDLTLTSTGTVAGYSGSRMAVTNGTGHMVKEGLAVSSSFYFPVGRDEADYTPANITNNGSAADAVHVAVKNYSESTSDEYDPSTGMDRTWNIYTDIGGGATVTLQHNSATNAGAYNTAGGDPSAFVTQYQGQQWVTSVGRNQGVWQTGTGGLGTYAVGTVASSSTHNRAYTSTATNATADAAFYSKSTNILSPLPVKLMNFNAVKFNEINSLVTWDAVSEINVVKYDVYRLNKNNTWEAIGSVGAECNGQMVCKYQFIDRHPYAGQNLYKLKVIEHDEEHFNNEIKIVYFGNSEIGGKISTLYPNPSTGELQVNSTSIIESITIMDLTGKVLMSIHPNADSQELDLSDLSAGCYLIKFGNEIHKWIKE